MTKTEMQIERDFYEFVCGSRLAEAIKGGVYRSEMRPYNSTAEDLIIKFLSGLDAQIQTGVVILNVYVPDVLLSDGRAVADKQRIAELQELIADFVSTAGGSEYWLATEATPTTYFIEDIKQHAVAARITFKRLSH